MHHGIEERRRLRVPACAALIIPILLLGAAPASATPFTVTPFTVTTTGTVAAGSDSANLLGAGPALAGDRYVLTLSFNGLGPSYYTDGGGQFAQDFGDAILGSVAVTIGQHTTTTVLAASTSAALSEDTADLNATNGGTDVAGNFASGAQSISTASNVITVADLQTPFSYTLQPGDTGLDMFSFFNAANTRTASFTGTTTSVAFSVPSPVPEPVSSALLGAGLLGLAATRRRATVR